MDFRGRRVTVVGAARSGVGAANLLSSLGAEVTLTDRRSGHETAEFLERLAPAVNREMGSHPERLFTEADLIVISPGVPLSMPQLQRAVEGNIPIIGELELAFLTLSLQPSAFSNGKWAFLAVTGTNGKSTTTMLLYEMMKTAGFETLLGGNIGYALTEELFRYTSRLTPHPDCIVAEVSSFQLETTATFSPKGSAILNITPDHLDRYASMDEYIDAKCRIFLNQGEGDFLVLNADDPMTGEILKRLESREASGLTPHASPELYFFSREKEVKGAWYKDGVVRFNLPGLLSDFSLRPSTFRIQGMHNLENAMAAGLMALLAGCRPEAVDEALRSFPGLEHRLEFVRELEGVQYINDSKGTNVGAVVKSLEGFTSPVVLIAGGRDKHGDFRALRSSVGGKVKALVLIGEARHSIAEALGDMAPVFMAEDLRAAVLKARELASPGETVLLSPACASFDMFSDFEDRGRQFKEVVRGL